MSQSQPMSRFYSIATTHFSTAPIQSVSHLDIPRPVCTSSVLPLSRECPFISTSLQPMSCQYLFSKAHVQSAYHLSSPHLDSLPIYTAHFKAVNKYSLQPMSRDSIQSLLPMLNLWPISTAHIQTVLNI